MRAEDEVPVSDLQHRRLYTSPRACSVEAKRQGHTLCCPPLYLFPSGSSSPSLRTAAWCAQSQSRAALCTAQSSPALTPRHARPTMTSFHGQLSA